jgi:hypothetical protein
MQIRADIRVPHPRAVVFAACRDDIAKLLPWLSNVRAIDVRSRKEDPPRIDIVNDWRGGGEIPAAIRAVLSESMLQWTDYATWDGERLTCDWRTETSLGPSLNASGRNTYLDDVEANTLIEVRGVIEIDAKKLPKVPSLLAGPVARLAETFLADKIQANLLETGRAVSKYLSAASH